MIKDIKILVIEDDKASSFYLKTILSSFGEVSVCEKGNEAISLFQEAVAQGEHFDVLFIDILLPELDGYHIAQFIRKWEVESNNDSYKPVLIMESSCAYTDDILKAFASGVNLYLTKPFSKSQIEGFMAECGFQKLPTNEASA
ncbi:MAG: response regulator [SAR324 cluster bacterium]|nr:response regulator [SAR324 cluster bacterium]